MIRFHGTAAKSTDKTSLLVKKRRKIDKDNIVRIGLTIFQLDSIQLASRTLLLQPQQLRWLGE